ncbi:phosphate ABC transporter, permease protein PstA [Komagataeibacter xylinus]|uniref:Phosphate transport system permease protein PstA n=1 Tax=Komagataeibacter xylinus TaxID=28448 RepID=A0A318PSB8_KOMXY|nr:phosphate ABC transporter permease PstA [Komagataeibacter xylinus]AZV37684.1 phosphate ABC transporter, permease protein PstA [Komagataeibacter xylinus]PYD58272.1 phosphate ABC transporter, permease protein PstA [Komagataeibacter xylinus]GBQ78837.1 phosphate ABC transporter permease [Komagataeibacter xylinus NBRC 15237]
MSAQKVQAGATDGWQRGGAQAVRRRIVERLVSVLCCIATVVVLFLLFSILWTLVTRGAAGLSLSTFLHSTAAPGSGGGLANAIVGSCEQTLLAALLGTPIGMLTGVYLSEFSHDGKIVSFVRFVSDMMLSVPSILVGLFVYLMVVEPAGHFSGMAGTLALAILFIPIVVRTTEDMLHLVPRAMREAAYALGAPGWRVIVSICLRAARGGIMTGILLALARISGETAPLLFTSLGNLNWSTNLNAPMASLPVIIYQYAGSAYDDWVQMAWTGALLITVAVLATNIFARWWLSRNGTASS